MQLAENGKLPQFILIQTGNDTPNSQFMAALTQGFF